jgi:hypothetical protein
MNDENSILNAFLSLFCFPFISHQSRAYSSAVPAPAAGGNLRALRQQMQLQGGTLRKGGAGAGGAGGTMNGRATMSGAANAASGMTIGQARAGMSGPGPMQSINYPKNINDCNETSFFLSKSIFWSIIFI